MGEVLIQIQQVPELVLILSDLMDAPCHREPALNSSTVTL